MWLRGDGPMHLEALREPNRTLTGTLRAKFSTYHQMHELGNANVCVCVCIRTYIYIYIYRERERFIYIYIYYTERERERERERETPACVRGRAPRRRTLWEIICRARPRQSHINHQMRWLTEHGEAQWIKSVD